MFKVEVAAGVEGPMSESELVGKYVEFARVNMPAGQYYVWKIQKI